MDDREAGSPDDLPAQHSALGTADSDGPGAPAPDADAGLTDSGLDTDAVVADEGLPPIETPARPAFAAGPDVPRATVVIVNYNGAHLLRACLDALARQSVPAGTFKVVVVDNASADPSRDLIREEYPDVHLLVSHRNTGFAGGNNLALDRLDTEFAVLLNNDAVSAPDWLGELLAPFDEPGNDDLVATTSKIVFLPRFVAVQLETAPFVPGGLDPRRLGVRVRRIAVDGIDVSDKVLWENAGYGPEDNAPGSIRWSFPSGEFLVPLPPDSTSGDHEITLEVSAPEAKPVTFTIDDRPTTLVAPSSSEATARLTITGDTARHDVVNNVGGLVFVDGAGADRGFQQIDRGQYDHPEEVFTACGNGVAIRSSAGSRVGWFDERYFMYYEDVDLSWRLRADGGRISYVPTALLRHIHSASSKPWSPRWLFHVERNRLLTLTKDASAGRAAKAVARFVGTTAKMTAREVVQSLRSRRRPRIDRIAVRAKVIGSYASLLPGILVDRRELGRTASVPREKLEEWLVTSR